MTMNTASPDQSSVLEQSSKFTPGPWAASPEKLFKDCSHVAGRSPRVETDRAIIADVRRQGQEAGRCEVAEANARLIAAAPDMLAALEMMVTWMPSGFAPDSQAKAMEMAYDAIRKAKAVGDRTDASAPSEGRLNQKPTAPGSA